MWSRERGAGRPVPQHLPGGGGYPPQPTFPSLPAWAGLCRGFVSTLCRAHGQPLAHTLLGVWTSLNPFVQCRGAGGVRRWGWGGSGLGAAADGQTARV